MYTGLTDKNGTKTFNLSILDCKSLSGNRMFNITIAFNLSILDCKYEFIAGEQKRIDKLLIYPYWIVNGENHLAGIKANGF